ncbi:MAG: KH domain-containing protein [Oscillospiraceae bacterium]|nr:KH domain-containing protein [Oscillospiraceae bacterium]
MEKEFSAKTVNEAKALAAAEFGADIDEIEFDILEQPRKTLFGGLKGEARVKAFYEKPEAAPEAPKAIIEDDDEEEAAVESAASIASDDDEDYEEGGLPEDFDVNSSIKVQTAIKYLTDVFHALGLENFKITPIKRRGNVVLDISGDKLGVVIGKRGETLDSLQYLTILASNRSEESFCRLSLDCNGYRDKRNEALEALAKKTSAKVIKQGRKIALEPMNPYERRIIHSCVAEIEGVSSRSTGTEPYRKVVIYADRPKYDNRDNRRRRSSGGSGAGARNYRQSGGFSTSFEREYKRKQYQPDENADAGEFSKETVDAERNATLYGKIDL